MPEHIPKDPRVTVTTGDRVKTGPIGPGQTLLDVLVAGDLPLPVHCGGNGACGQCRIRIEAGPVPPPTPAERRHLDADDIAAGVRLGCQVRPSADLAVRPVQKSLPASWRPLTSREMPAPVPAGATGNCGSRRQYGLAVDLGTTHLRATLWDLSAGKRLAGRACLNPHTRFGADILGRLAAAGWTKSIT